MKCGYSGSHQPGGVEIRKDKGGVFPAQKLEMSLKMTSATTEEATRLDELWNEYFNARDLLDSGYVDYDQYESVERSRGVLKDVCKSCLVGSFEDTDLDMGISNTAGYEGHEDMTGGTCALCNEDFWGMKGGSLVLFEPKFSLERWG